MEAFHFLRPAWLLALPACLLLVWLGWRQVRTGAGWRAVIDRNLLPWLLDESTTGGWKRSYLLLLAGWVLAVIAVAGPAWEKLPSELQRRLDLQIVLFDLSVSMYAQDVRPSRLQRARHKLQDLLQRREEGQTALIAYAGDAFTVTPFTDDRATVLNQVQALDPTLMPALGSDLRTALREAGKLLDEVPARHVRVLLITDEVRPAQLDFARSWFRKRDVPLDILAVGTASGAPVPLPGGDFARDRSGRLVTPATNLAELRELAADTGGRFQELQPDDADVEALLAAGEAWNPDAEEVAGRTADTYRDAGPWLALALLPVAALGFRRGYLALLPCLLLAGAPQPAQAFGWADLWSNRDQRAHLDFEQGEYDAAAENFRHPEWQASALYREGRYREAAERLQQLDSPRAHYNRGNALAQAGSLQEALEAYDQALVLDPENGDARANRELVERLLEEQEQQESAGNPEQDSPTDSREQDSSGSPSAGQQEPGQDAETDPQQDRTDRVGNTGEPDASGEQESGPAEQEPGQPEDREAASAPEPDPPPDGDQDASAANAAEQSKSAEHDQALEQWLRRIPDDPSALLRRKFLWQYQQRSPGKSEPEPEGQYW